MTALWTEDAVDRRVNAEDAWRCAAAGFAAGACKMQRRPGGRFCTYHRLLSLGLLEPALEKAYIRTTTGWLPRRERFQ